MRANIKKKPGSADIAADMRQMKENLSDLDGLLRAIGDLVFQILQESFEEGKAPSGAKWAKLANSTIKLKAHYGFPSAPLVRTGRLRNGVLVSIEDKNTITIGFSPELESYARFHQQGTANAPARPLITALSPEDARRLRGLIEAHIAREVKGLKEE